jgi:hypothetical protein
VVIKCPKKIIDIIFILTRRIRKIIYLLNVKHVVTNVPPATLEIKPGVNKKSLVSRSAFGFIISRAPHFRNPYLTKVTNQLGFALRPSRQLFDISRTFEITVSVFQHNFKCLKLDFC